MSHIVGKVYEVNKENMNKLIEELEEAQSAATFLKMQQTRLLLALENIHDDRDIHKSVAEVRAFCRGVINIEEGLWSERRSKRRDPQDEGQDLGAGEPK